MANQAVQINQGSLSTQGFSRGHYCNGSVISFAPYVLQTESMASSYATSASYGGQISLSMPLDGGAVELCKELGRRQLDKSRLDYELVRIKECINIYKAGFQILPASPFYPICADIVPIAAAPPVDPSELLKSDENSTSSDPLPVDISEPDVPEPTMEESSPESSSVSSE